jgi:hypothetical protein
MVGSSKTWKKRRWFRAQPNSKIATAENPRRERWRGKENDRVKEEKRKGKERARERAGMKRKGEIGRCDRTAKKARTPDSKEDGPVEILCFRKVMDPLRECEDSAQKGIQVRYLLEES